MRLDGVEQLVAGLLQEGVDAEVEGVEVRGQGVGGDGGVVGELGEGGGEGVGGGGGWGGGELVEEGGEEVGVVDGEGEFDEDVLVAEVALLEAGCRVSKRAWYGVVMGTYVSVVNFPSLNAAMKLVLSRYAFRFKLP